MIEVERLTKVYAGGRKKEPRPAVAEVSFTCLPGAIYALLGPNGAGKTTTLRMIATTLMPTSGTARVCGHDLCAAPREVRRSIGFLTGNTDLYGRLKAREVLHYFGRLYGVAQDVLKRRIDDLAGILDMQAFLERRCDKLSQGMKQKVSIARSIIHDPPAVILDEPTTGLDVITSRAIVDFIRSCRDQGKTVLFSTHIMPEAAKLADRIGILHEGRIILEGTTSEILQQTGAADLEDAFLLLASPSAEHQA